MHASADRSGTCSGKHVHWRLLQALLKIEPSVIQPKCGAGFRLMPQQEKRAVQQSFPATTSVNNRRAAATPEKASASETRRSTNSKVRMGPAHPNHCCQSPGVMPCPATAGRRWCIRRSSRNTTIATRRREPGAGNQRRPIGGQQAEIDGRPAGKRRNRKGKGRRLPCSRPTGRERLATTCSEAATKSAR